MVKPFLRWPGGKSRILEKLDLPEFKNYFEPFIGGGALFLSAAPTCAYISDINPELINVYNVIKHKPHHLIKALKKYKNTEDYYYALRNIDRLKAFSDIPDIERASRYIFLNKTCFNGYMRQNKNGHLNISYGRLKNPYIPNADHIMEIHKNLRTARITSAPFHMFFPLIGPGDFVYFDPPYDGDEVDYTPEKFGYKDQHALFSLCVKIHKRGAFFMLSNAATDRVLNLYKRFNIECLDAPRTFSSSKNSRKPAREVIIKNYGPGADKAFVSV